MISLIRTVDQKDHSHTHPVDVERRTQTHAQTPTQLLFFSSSIQVAVESNCLCTGPPLWKSWHAFEYLRHEHPITYGRGADHVDHVEHTGAEGLVTSHIGISRSANILRQQPRPVLPRASNFDCLAALLILRPYGGANLSRVHESSDAASLLPYFTAPAACLSSFAALH